MRESLRVDFAAAHFFHIQRDFFSIFQFLITGQLLQVDLLNFAMLRPDDFARRRIHRHGRFLSTQLGTSAFVTLSRIVTPTLIIIAPSS